MTYVSKLELRKTTMNFGTAFEGWSRLHNRAIYKFQSPWSVRFRRASTNPVGMTDPHLYCKDLVRKYDYDSFLTSYFYPQEAQGGFFAIKAFSVSTPP
jgi:NADH dehydrogenase [ubiquinone] 1 alpha subcomplex assembly factor 6